MEDDFLKTALEHDAAIREGRGSIGRYVILAAECLRNAAVASRAAEAGLMVCRPPGLEEAAKAARLAIESLEQALTLIAMESKSNE